MTNRTSSNLAFLLLDLTGSVCGRWSGKLSAKSQRALFGRYLGKGTITIDGTSERVLHTVKVCFGLDYDVTADLTWRELEIGA